MPGFSSLIAVLSLNLTLSLVNDYSVVARTFPVTGATTSVPISLTSPAHGVPLGRVVHGVVTGIAGTTEANGLWVLTPTDGDHFDLTTYTAQGIVVPSSGVHAYTGGGQVQVAFPDYQILLGRRWVAASSAVASPRVVFVPTDGKAWNFEPYGGVGEVASMPPVRGSAESQSARLEPQLATEFATFEVYVTGAATPPSPDFGDFEAAQFLVGALYAVLFDAVGGLPRAKILHESWPSQSATSGTQTQRGQQWCGVLELQLPIRKLPLSFVPHGTSLVLTVEPINPGSTDATIITIV
jgi:hypothetical protein